MATLEFVREPGNSHPSNELPSTKYFRARLLRVHAASALVVPFLDAEKPRTAEQTRSRLWNVAHTDGLANEFVLHALSACLPAALFLMSYPAFEFTACCPFFP